MFTPFPPSLFSANEKKMRTYHQNGNPSDDYTLVSSGVTGCWGDIWIYDGPRTTWYENGQLRSSVQYEYGRLEGQQVEWYKNGRKKGEYNFKKGKADGFTTIWYENGQKKVEGTCTNGMPDGLWSGWSPDGIIGLSALLTIILLSTPYYYGLLHGLNVSYATAGVFVGFLGCFLAIATIVYADRIPIQLRNKFHLFDQLCDCASRIRLLNISSIRTWEIAGISILGQIFQPLKYYLLALAIGAEIGFLDFFFLTPFVTLAVAVPIGIAGWGVREGSMVAIFSIIGSRPEDMLAISLFSGIIVTIAALPGSISWFLLANTRKQRGE